METKEFPTQRINTDNSNKEFTGPLPPLDEIDTTNIDPTTTIELGNETASETETEPIETNSTELNDNTAEKSNNKKKIIVAISGIALVAVGMVTYVGSAFGFSKGGVDTNVAPPKSQTESTQSTHETNVNATKPNSSNSSNLQTVESNSTDSTASTSFESTDSQTDQTTSGSSETSEAQPSTQEKNLSTEYIPTSYSELMKNKINYTEELSSVESINMLFDDESPKVDEIGSLCFELAKDGGYLDSMYDKKWEYKRVDADSSMEDIVNNTNIEFAAALAANKTVDGKAVINRPEAYAITNYTFDNRTGVTTKERDELLAIIDKVEIPTKILNLEVPVSSSEVYKCQRENGEITRSVVIVVKIGETLHKRAFSEKLVKDFKGREYTHMKVSMLSTSDSTDEQVLATANLTIIK